jgi:hypothetical protein
MKTFPILLLAVFLVLLNSCSNKPKRKILDGDAPPQAERDSDGRLKNRDSQQNKKRVEYYNKLQHK